MSHIDKTIADLPNRSAKDRANLRRNADAMLKKSPGQNEALRLLVALDAFDASRAKPAKLEQTGLLAWEKYQKGEATPFRAYHGDRVVGRIIKRANHSGTKKDVYSVEILDQILAGVFHHISEARAAGEAAFHAQQKEGKA